MFPFLTPNSAMPSPYPAWDAGAQLNASRLLKHTCFPVPPGHRPLGSRENNPTVFTGVHDLGDNHLRQEATKPACRLFSWRLEASPPPAQCGGTYRTQSNFRPCAHRLSVEKPSSPFPQRENVSVSLLLEISFILVRKRFS